LFIPGGSRLLSAQVPRNSLKPKFSVIWRLIARWLRYS
jgi:hypothetical protein